MTSAVTEQSVVAAEAGEKATLERVAHVLGRGDCRPRLVGARGGEEIELPASLARLLADVVELLRRGDGVTVVPYQRELTTQQAADLLNVSRPYLIRLLDADCIPYRRLGTHRRLRLGDVVAYKARRDAERRVALDELTALSQEAGLYGVARRRSRRASG
jgi:excisionase family DNA binding protein